MNLDSIDRVPGNGKVTVLEDVEKKKKRTNGLIDRHARAANKEAWLRSHEADNDQVPEGWAEKAMRTQNFIRHAPVFSHCT